MLASQALMSSRDISLILATGGPQMVRRAVCAVQDVHRIASGSCRCLCGCPQRRCLHHALHPFATQCGSHTTTPQVRAAYSSGTPALGVGAGNTPAVIDETADIKMAVSSVLVSKTFDNGKLMGCLCDLLLPAHRRLSAGQPHAWLEHERQASAGCSHPCGPRALPLPQTFLLACLQA